MASSATPAPGFTPLVLSPGGPNAGLPVGPANPNAGSTLVPTDSRPVRQSAQIAPPISGGTLLVTTDGSLAVAADPDRDRVLIVDLPTESLLAAIPLQAGDEPGRLAQDDAGHVHVALRRAGAIVSIDLATRAIVARRSVCGAPRGIAFEPSTGLLLITCVGGELVSLPAAGGEATGSVALGVDLRDIVLGPSGMAVTRLKTAELIRLDAARAQLGSTRPPTSSFFFVQPDGSRIIDTLEPELARRTIGASDGGSYMLHQGARNGDIPLQNDTDHAAISAYGSGGDACNGVVSTEITHFDPNGMPLAAALLSDVLAVDIAESRVNGELAVAVAGSHDLEQPEAEFIPAPSNTPTKGRPAISSPTRFIGSGATSVTKYNPITLSITAGPIATSCAVPTEVISVDGQVTAVAYLSDGRLLFQTREPAALWLASATGAPTTDLPDRIDLGGVSMYDSGHEIFHRDAGAGLACATCHVEGADDGHVWHFKGQGPRRTQALHVGLEGTAPFHWTGDMPDIATLMENVFVGRMGGPHETVERVDVLTSWLFQLLPPAPLRQSNDPAAMRGKTLFEGAAKCSTCHNGPKLTNNMTVDVGTGLALQVPSLVGIAYHGPWLHTGCAQTLRERFAPQCGGSAHGETSQLADDQIDDLVAYLETL
jgi:hypothetical protein